MTTPPIQMDKQTVPDALLADLAEHLSACLGSIPAGELQQRLAYSLERCGLALSRPSLEPSEEMIRAGVSVLHGTAKDSDTYTVEQIYRAMQQASLHPIQNGSGE